MDESLRTAAAIRRKIKGRHHSDSTKLVREDRGYSKKSSAERELALENLIADVTEENRHAEIDFGPPVGKEKC